MTNLKKRGSQKQKSDLPSKLSGICSDWPILTIDEVSSSDESSLVDGPFGSNLKSDEFSKEGYARVVQLQNIRSAQFVDENKKYISKKKLEELDRHSASPGDIAIAKMSEPVARACLLPEHEERYIVVADCMKLTVDTDQFNSFFVMYALNSTPLWKQAYARSRGSTRKRINLSELKKIEIPSPHKSEQRKIASILYTVDQAIQKTEAIIEQTKRVKKGLMQDFFGVFNPIRERDNPANVDLFELTDIVELANGHAFSTDNLSDNEEGFKVIRISNLTNHDHEFWYYDGDIEGKCIVTDGDLLFSWAGMKTSIGVHLWGGDKSLLNQHIYKIVPTDVLSKEYLYYYLDYVMKDIHSLSQGGAVQIHLTKSEIERIKVPFLAEDERESIVQNLQLLDRIQKINYQQKARLKRLKKGLMQDLLTGQVRTHDKDIEVLDEVKAHG